MAVCDICGKRMGFSDMCFSYQGANWCQTCNEAKVVCLGNGSDSQKASSMEYLKKCVSEKKYTPAGEKAIVYIASQVPEIAEYSIEAEEEYRKKREEEYQFKLDYLKSRGANGYYEYKVVSLLDNAGLFKSNSGRIDAQKMTETLNDLGIEGWHLVTAYSNEAGKNALSGGAGGAMIGVNSTVDENILIFERFVTI